MREVSDIQVQAGTGTVMVGENAALQTARAFLLPYPLDKHDVGNTCLAITCFSPAGPRIELVDGILRFDIPQPGAEVVECWCAESCGESGDRESGTNEYGAWVSGGGHLFAAAKLEAGNILAPDVEKMYQSLIDLVRGKGFQAPYRIWNYIGSINAPNAQGLERYRDFSIGRAKAFERAGFLNGDLPAATGIGVDGEDVYVFLIARKDMAGENVENPKQVPAFLYPAEYGPRSPSFARATWLNHYGDCALYVSGTASILGHRSIVSDLRTQIVTTLDNMTAVVSHACELNGKVSTGWQSLKVYYRHDHDLALIKQTMERDICDIAGKVAFIRSDICREELDVEIEGIALATAP